MGGYYIKSEKYYHYMGKAILHDLHHEPSFIYDALCDPTFRYEYDKMLEEMQIIDKLDNDTDINEPHPEHNLISSQTKSDGQFEHEPLNNMVIVLNNLCIVQLALSFQKLVDNVLNSKWQSVVF